MLTCVSTYSKSKARKSLIVLFIVFLGVIFLASELEKQHQVSSLYQAKLGVQTRDLDFYKQVNNRVRSGEGYYSATLKELIAGDYPHHSVFNFRLPTLNFLWSAFPSENVAYYILIFLGFLSLFRYFRFWNYEQNIKRPLLYIGNFILLGSLIYCFQKDSAQFHDIWAGVLVSLSLLSFLENKTKEMLFWGALALSIREFSLVYVIVMMLMSIKDARKYEWRYWLGLIMLFMGFFLIHYNQVLRINPSMHSSEIQHWLKFVGLYFVLKTVQFHLLVLFLPLWGSALFLALALLGMWSVKFPGSQRLKWVFFSYISLFFLIGREANAYWGLLYLPLFSIGVFYGIIALKELISIALRVD